MKAKAHAQGDPEPEATNPPQTATIDGLPEPVDSEDLEIQRQVLIDCFTEIFGERAFVMYEGEYAYNLV